MYVYFMKLCLFFRGKNFVGASSFCWHPVFTDTIPSRTSRGNMHALFALSIAALLSCVVLAADDITAQIRADMETAMIAQAERGFADLL